MSLPLPPIYRDCGRLLVHTEEPVRRFTRWIPLTPTPLPQGERGFACGPVCVLRRG